MRQIKGTAYDGTFFHDHEKRKLTMTLFKQLTGWKRSDLRQIELALLRHRSFTADAFKRNMRNVLLNTALPQYITQRIEVFSYAHRYAALDCDAEIS